MNWNFIISLNRCWNKVYSVIDLIFIAYMIQSSMCHCERRGAKRSKLAVESFFPQSYGTFKQRNIYETIDFFWHGLYRKSVSIWPYNRFPNWTGPAITLFDALFLNEFKIHNFRILTLCCYQFSNCRIKFWTKHHTWFQNYSISRETSFLAFS